MRALILVFVLAFGSARAAEPPVILVLGDSLSAAYGMPLQSGWVWLLQKRLEEQGYPHRVVNGSISGETTSGGLARLPRLLQQHRPAFVLIELGGNDGLRGLPLARMRTNLTALVRASRHAGARALLFEMQVPPNYGEAYSRGFHATFREVAAAEGATLVPFFLEKLVNDPEGFQDDGIHPTVAAQKTMLESVWPVLQPQLGGAAPAAADKRQVPRSKR